MDKKIKILIDDLNSLSNTIEEIAQKNNISSSDIVSLLNWWNDKGVSKNNNSPENLIKKKLTAFGFKSEKIISKKDIVKKREKKLLVIFPNGEKICENTAKYTYIKTLKKIEQTIGLDKVASLDNNEMIRQNKGKKWKIISKIKPILELKHGEKGYEQIGEWYIITNYSIKQFAKKLEYISYTLDLKIVIEKI